MALNRPRPFACACGCDAHRDPTPGDWGRSALFTDPDTAANQLLMWAGDVGESSRIVDWFEAVYVRMRELMDGVK